MAAKLARVPSGRELYHLQFSLQAVSPETFVYTLVKSFSFVAFIITFLVCRLLKSKIQQLQIKSSGDSHETINFKSFILNNKIQMHLYG
jgi:hypothetical protein